MPELNILSWNASGFNSPHKRISTLGLLYRMRINVALVQETHLLAADIRRLADKHYHVIASSTSGSKTKAVAIVARCSFRIKIQDTWFDAEGRLTIVKTEINNRKIAFISVYAPNCFDSFFTTVKKQCHRGTLKDGNK